MATDARIGHNRSMNIWSEGAVLAQVVLIDVSLAGDNAIVLGTAAASLPEALRRRALFYGVAGATLLRILFAVFAVRLLAVTGLLAAGGFILLWVAWKMYRDIRTRRPGAIKRPSAAKLSSAVMQIIAADVSMSLDNVLAVAGAAREHLGILALGLFLSVVLMGAASNLIARWTARHAWIAYAGLAVVLFTALHMMWEGTRGL